MRAKTIKESGAGYSMSGGRTTGMSRKGTGFGGASNSGGSSQFYSYELKPLNHSLEPKLNFTEQGSTVHIGDEISGKEINKRNPTKIYTGSLQSIYKSPNTNQILYYIILDRDSKTRIKIDPHTVQILGPKETADTKELTGDAMTGEYVKQHNNENYKAKFVNEAIYPLPISPNVMPKPGDRIECIKMHDLRPIRPGTKGTVNFIDGLQGIHVDWDNGRTLALIPEIDRWKIINEARCPECLEIFNYMSIPESGMGYVKCPVCSCSVTQKDLIESIMPEKRISDINIPGLTSENIDIFIKNILIQKTYTGNL